MEHTTNTSVEVEANAGHCPEYQGNGFTARMVALHTIPSSIHAI